MKGRYPKDTIVPYYTESSDGYIFTQKFKGLTSRNDNASDDHRSILLTFVGRSNQAVRGKIIDMYEPYSKNSKVIPSNRLFGLSRHATHLYTNYHEVTVTHDKFHNISDYHNILYHSKFCLIVRGDTTSSSRLFSALAFGCIPIILSDWILLPYESIINYNKFSIFLEESFIMNQEPEEFINFLKNIPSDKMKELQSNLLQAKEILCYDTTSEYNPVSLMLMDNIINRINLCMNMLGNANILDAFYQTPKNSMCRKLQNRLKSMANTTISEFFEKIIQSNRAQM